jgi:hypothetical protein
MRYSIGLGFALLVTGCARYGSERTPTEQPGAPKEAVPASSPKVDGTHPSRARDSKDPPDSNAGFTAGIVERAASPLGIALLTDVRYARHEGFDRVVFEFSGGPLPGYHLEYIDKPVRQCGSGEVTPIAGDAWLEVRFSPANAHTESGSPTIRFREQKVDLHVIRELERTCDFEAHVTWVLGVTRPNQFRVLTLQAPVRLVVDVKRSPGT